MMTGMLIVMLVASLALLVYVGVYALSKQNILFSPEVAGEVKVAMWNDKPSKFFGIIPDGPYLDSDDKTVKYGERHIDPTTGKMRAGKASPSLLSKWFGVVWIGWPPYGSIHKWPITYAKWHHENNGVMTQEIVPDRSVDSLHVLPTFALLVQEAETADNVRLTLKGKYTLGLLDGMASIFTTKTWWKNIDIMLEGATAAIIRAKTFTGFMKQPLESGMDKELDPEKAVEEAKDAVKDGTQDGIMEQIQSISSLMARYGFVLMDISFSSIEIIGSEEVIKATTALVVAKKTALAVIETARGEMEATKHKANGITALRVALAEQAEQLGTLWTAEAIAKHEGPLALGTGIMPTHEHAGDDSRKVRIK